jgi:antitoxin YefM
MKVINYTEFRKNLTKNLDTVNNDRDIVVISRSKGKNIVVMSLDEYNSIQETLFLMSSNQNRKRLEEAILEMEKGKYLKKQLIEK